MTLLDKLRVLCGVKGGIEGAKVLHFALAEDGSMAYLAELPVEELIFEMEKWCRQARLEMGAIH